ncbi:hypothetical protein BD560DRAFT_401032 [Blakeslea trispora]|nr:hypothetical protein BD560DRAFT_401032 [Blakeslea trispora]
MFTAFGGIKKREPLFTFKRKTNFGPTLDSPSNQISNTPYVTSSTNTLSGASSILIHKTTTLQKNTAAQPLKKSIVVEKGQEDVAIFDFPDKLDKKALEIKLMVAERRAVPDTKVLLNRKKSKSKSNKTSPSPSCSPSSSNTTANSSPSNSPNTQKKPTSSNMKRKPSTKKHTKTAIASNNSATAHIHKPTLVISQPSSNGCEDLFDPFAFDPQPTSHLSHRYTPHLSSTYNTSYSHNRLDATRKQPNILPKPPTVSSHSSKSNSEMDIDQLLNQPLNLDAMVNLLDSSHFSSNSNFSDPYPYTSVPLPISHYPVTSPNNNNTYTSGSSLYHTAQATPLPSTAHSISTTASTCQTDSYSQPTEKKRKRNLVAHLKSASGEKEKKQPSQGFNFLSSDEEEESEADITNILPIREIINHVREKSPSPELSYEQKMERELEAMMQSEFGMKNNSTANESEAASRPRYQPLNKVNVRVTFQKKKN